MPAAEQLTYRPEIDGLRAVAVTVVVLFHAGLGFGSGYIGVDLFFVISGYLITSLLLKQMHAGTFSFLSFYERRIRRILPASLVMTAVVLAAGYAIVLPLDFERLGQSSLAHVAFISNVFFLQATDYFGGSAKMMPLLHTWSLAVEEQFYAIFPALLWLCFRWGRARSVVPVVIGVAFAASLFFSIHQTHTNPRAAFFMLPSRMWELLSGSIVAIAPRCRWPRLARETTASAAIVSMVALSMWLPDKIAFPGAVALLPCSAAAVFIWASDRKDGDTLVARLLGSRPMVAGGLLSYSLYLTHWPIFVMANYWRITPLPAGERWLLVAASVAAAILLWATVERPFHRRKIAPSSALLLLSVGAIAAVVVMVGALIVNSQGAPRRFSALVNACDSVRRQKTGIAQLEIADVQAKRLSPFGDQHAPPSILLWGDSHAGMMQPAFDDACRALHLAGRAATRSATTPVLDYAANDDPSLNRWALQFSAAVLDYVKRQHVQTVFLVGYWHRDLDEGGATFLAKLKLTIAALNDAGANVYILLQVPVYDVNVPKVLAREAMLGHALKGWRQSLQQHCDAQTMMYTFAKQNESSRCHFVDPAPVFQPRGQKQLVTAEALGRPIYRDEHHLSAWGARRMLDALLNKAIMSSTTAATRATKE